MWKQSCGDWCGDQLRKHAWSRSVKWQKRSLHLSQLSSRWIHAANRWIRYPKKNSNPNKFLHSETDAFDQRHIFAFRVRCLWTPALSWIRICVNTSKECVNSTTKEFCSGNMGCALLMTCVVWKWACSDWTKSCKRWGCKWVSVSPFCVVWCHSVRVPE